MRPLIRLRPGEALLVVASSALFALLLADVMVGGIVADLDEDVVRAVATSDGGPLWAQAAAATGSLGISGGVVAIMTLVCAHVSWRWWPLLLASFNLAATGTVVAVVKALVSRRGPPTAATNPDFTGYFPSGHTATAVICFGTAAFLAMSLTGRGPGDVATPGSRSSGKRATQVGLAVGVGFGLLVGIGTLVTGNHWPTDIAAGLLVGIVVLTTGIAIVRTRLSGAAAPRSR